MTEMKLKVDGVERERDFYYDKLRDIEILCQMNELQELQVSLHAHESYHGTHHILAIGKPGYACSEYSQSCIEQLS